MKGNTKAWLAAGALLAAVASGCETGYVSGGYATYPDTYYDPQPSHRISKKWLSF